MQYNVFGSSFCLFIEKQTKKIEKSIESHVTGWSVRHQPNITGHICFTNHKIGTIPLTMTTLLENYYCANMFNLGPIIRVAFNVHRNTIFRVSREVFSGRGNMPSHTHTHTHIPFRRNVYEYLMLACEWDSLCACNNPSMCVPPSRLPLPLPVRQQLTHYFTWLFLLICDGGWMRMNECGWQIGDRVAHTTLS